MSKRTNASWLIGLVIVALPVSTQAQTAPTFVGIRTFLSAPYQPDLDKLNADFAVLGVPFDEGLVGLDIVEVNPYRDPSGRTAQTAVRLMVDLLGAAFK
jgi:arginase family enzyme